MLTNEDVIIALKYQIKDIAINNEKILMEYLNSLAKTKEKVGKDELHQLLDRVQNVCRPVSWMAPVTTDAGLVPADRFLAQQAALLARTQDAAGLTAAVSTDISAVSADTSVSTVGAAEAEKLQRRVQAERRN